MSDVNYFFSVESQKSVEHELVVKLSNKQLWTVGCFIDSKPLVKSWNYKKRKQCCRSQTKYHHRS